MAVEQIITKSRLQITLDLGYDVDGKIVLKNKNYNNIKTTATAGELYATTQALVPLQQHPMKQLERTNEYHIVDMPA